MPSSKSFASTVLLGLWIVRQTTSSSAMKMTVTYMRTTQNTLPTQNTSAKMYINMGCTIKETNSFTDEYHMMQVVFIFQHNSH